MTPHSDNGVDRLVAELFGPFVGHACEVGAHDGRGGSNALAFEEAGWTVLCVEPNPHLAERGRAARKLWRQVAAGAADSDTLSYKDCVEFACFGSEFDSASNSAIGTISRYDGAPASKIVLVPMRRLDRILDEAGFPRLDYLTVDVEGWEREVMSGFDIDRWRPRVIVLEDWHDNGYKPPGYTLKERRTFDNVFVRDGDAAR